ncbi:alphan-acetylglucosamine transferase [Fusarium mundagurra]|uniref:Alphan-acetylglucosamine transferase n=1 Tax=Fusarium mundagurra TaxID=1567541 RepID=A0A8H5Y1E9_9HYPO|nr:alphan-acetylglucosamine transferase [Fusarium mundagurra]
MTLPVTAWKCLFIYKSQQALCPTYAHIVGPSPHPHLLEVAVPLQTVATLPWVVMTPDITVSIDHMVTPEKKDKLGYIVAYQEMLLLFIKNAREGIRRHGASLGDYYRHRYPNFRSWVEYAVLLEDLPYLPDLWVSRLSLQQKRSFEALVEEASAISDQARHSYNIQQLFVIWTYTQGSSASSCQEVIKPQLRKLFKTAAHHLANSESRTQIVLDTMTLFCIARLFAEQEPRKKILDPLNRFDAILNTGYQADTPMVLDYCLVSLHRVLVASDFIGRSVHLANFVAQLGLPQLMLGMNDCYIDVYWSQRLLDGHPHLCALNATKQQVGLSIKLPPLQLDDESADDCITVKVDNPDTETPVLLDEDTGRSSNEKEDLQEIAYMALSLVKANPNSSMFSQLLCASIMKYAGLSALLLVEIICLLIIFFVVPCTTAYFSWFIHQRVAVLDIPEIKHTQATFFITIFHAFFLTLLAWGTIPYYSYKSELSRESHICVSFGFWLLFLAYISTSMFTIHVVAYWEVIFDINNMAAISKECKAMLFVVAISLILALVLITTFMRLEDHEGLFPPLMEQVFADFRFSCSVHWSPSSGVFVVTGTSTMHIVARFIEHTVPLFNKTIALTGAIKPLTAYGADGPGHVLSAIYTVATYCLNRVVILMENKIMLPRRSYKHYNTFVPGDGSLLGSVVNFRPEIFNAPRDIPKTFDIQVEEEEFARAIQEGVKAAVLGVYDDGYFPEPLTEGLKKLTDQVGFIVAAVSYGHTFDVRGRIDGVVPASDWTDRTLMMMMPFVLSSNMTWEKRMEFIAEPYVKNERACAMVPTRYKKQQWLHSKAHLGSTKQWSFVSAMSL